MFLKFRGAKPLLAKSLPGYIEYWVSRGQQGFKGAKAPFHTSPNATLVIDRIMENW